MRLLPWTGEGGKACFLTADEPSFMSRLADYCEDVQLGMAEDLLRHVQETVSAGPSSETTLRHLIVCLSGSLRDVIRVAESRGDRLPVRDDDEDDELSRAARSVIDSTVVPWASTVTGLAGRSPEVSR